MCADMCLLFVLGIVLLMFSNNCICICHAALCLFLKLAYKEECETLLVFCFFFWFINLMPGCSNLT